MIDEGTLKKKEKKVYKVVLILLVGLAAISGARKDLNQLLSLAHDVQSFANHWLGGILPTVHARTDLPAEVCRASSAPGSDEFLGRGCVTAGEPINGEVTLEPTANLSTQVSAQTVNDQISSESSLALVGAMCQKHVRQRIGIGRSKLVLKTQNGNINLGRTIRDSRLNPPGLYRFSVLLISS